MTNICRVAVGEDIREFDEMATDKDVWQFVNSHMASAENEKALVFMDAGGYTLGCIWDSSQYFAHMETEPKMLSYFRLCQFAVDD